MSIHRVRCVCNHTISDSTFKCVSSIVVVCGWVGDVAFTKENCKVWCANSECIIEDGYAEHLIMCAVGFRAVCLERLLPSSLCKFAHYILSLNVL